LERGRAIEDILDLDAKLAVMKKKIVRAVEEKSAQGDTGYVYIFIRLLDDGLLA